jgi:Fic family protein
MAFDKNLPFNELPDLPPSVDLETVDIFRLTINANKLLAELKGFCQTLPNLNMLLNTIMLQESKESSAIENIVTTQDELYQATLNFTDRIKSSAAKEVIQYREAMYWGVEQMKVSGLITTNLLVGIMQKLRGTDDNIRRNYGTKLANPVSKEVVYTPPEGEEIIRNKMASLEKFINDDRLCHLDPLIKMALIHYQFEAIHPFSDGNGRAGRILNVLYLINNNLLSLPVLYLSRYIIHNKPDYYRLLREVTEQNNWVEWIKFVLQGVAITSALTLNKINNIIQLKEEAIPLVKTALGAAHSKEIVDLLFTHPYIKISVIENSGLAKRQTASEYLKKIERNGLLKSYKIGKEIYYVNEKLMTVLSQ